MPAAALTRRHQRRRRATALSMVVALLASPAIASETTPRRFQLNQNAIEDLSVRSTTDACDWRQVLADLLGQAGPRAHVFPSENYFYFQFYRGGRSWSGSLRFPVDTRDQGVVQFVCYETYNRWLDNRDTGVELELGPADGVSVVRAAPLEYRVEFASRTTTFTLNRIDQSPNQAILEPGEEFAGRTLDESGLGFDVLFIPGHRAFIFVLNEIGGASEGFVEVEPDVLLGRRTGFVFFRESARDRLLLIAVQADETWSNTHNDGPFDHLPENDYQTLRFLDRVYDAYPTLRGRLTEGGSYRDSNLIFGLSPYREYTGYQDLDFVKACRAKAADPLGLRLCLTGQEDSSHDR